MTRQDVGNTAASLAGYAILTGLCIVVGVAVGFSLVILVALNLAV